MQNDKLSWGIFASIGREDRILVKRRSDGTWDLPGGGQEPGEFGPVITLCREVFEEVRMRVTQVNGMIGTYLPFHVAAKGVTDIACIYDVVVTGGEPACSPEATALRWITLDDAMKWIVDGDPEGAIVGPKDRVGRTPRMILDAALVRIKPEEHFVTDDVPQNFDVPVAPSWQASRDGLWLVRRFSQVLYAWRRRDPFEHDGLMKTA